MHSYLTRPEGASAHPARAAHLRIRGDGTMIAEAGVATDDFSGVFILPSGTRLSLRTAEPTDRDRIHELFHRLSEESRYRRYLTPKPTLSERELTYLSDIDHFSHEAFAAVDPLQGSFVGLVRVVQRTDWPQAAELAIEVADDLQQLGIGSWLTATILERARELGFAALTATTLRENLPARALLTRFGFKPRTSSGPEIELIHGKLHGYAEAMPALSSV